MKRTLQGCYKNKEAIAQAMTLLTGSTEIKHREVIKGQSVVILPKEQIEVTVPVECTIVTLKIDWRNDF